MTMNQQRMSYVQPGGSPDAQASDPDRITRLVLFFCACLAVGGVILFCLLSPRINPSILMNTMLKREFSGLEKNSISGMGLFGPDPIVEMLEHPERKMDFRKVAQFAPTDVEFKAQDGAPLHGWFFDTVDAKGTALICWGNIADMRFPVALGYVKMLQQAHLSVMLFDYRGYGKSSGTSSIDTVLLDGEGAYNFLVTTKKIEPDKVILLGHELGSYVVCQISAKHRCRALILEEPFENAKQFEVDSLQQYAMRPIPLAMFPGDGLDTLKFLKAQHVPVLIVATALLGEQPQKVYSQAAQPKDFLKLKTTYADVDHPDFVTPTNKYSVNESEIYANKITNLAGLK